MYAWVLKPGFRYSRINCYAFRSGKFARHFCTIYTFPQSKCRIRRRRSAVESQQHRISFLKHTCLYTREMSHVVIRDYHIGTLVIAGSINPRPHYQARGRGLILTVMTKVPCYNLLITYSKTFFQNNFD